MKRVGIWLITVMTVALVITLFVVAMPQISGNYHIRFNAYIVGLIISMLSMVLLIGLILRSRAKGAVVAWFSALVMCCFFWAGTYLLMAWSANGETAQYWQHMLAVFFVPLPVIVTLLIASYVDDEGALRTPLLWLVMPISTLILAYLMGYGDMVYTRTPFNQVFRYWGFESEFAPWASLIYIWLGLVSVIAIILLTQAYRNETNPFKRKQTRIIMIALVQFIVSGVLFDIIYYIYFPNGFRGLILPPLIFAYSSAMAIIMGYGIIRYGVFRVSPAALSSTILANLSEAVIGVNRDFGIEFSNKGTQLITGYKQSLLKGQPIKGLFSEEQFADIVKTLNSGQDYFIADDTFVRNKEQGQVPVSLSVSGVYDDRGNLGGYIFVFANISELKKKTIELAREKENVEQKVRERTAELSEERARLSASINSLKLGYMLTGPNHQILMMNQASQRILERLSVAQDMSIPTTWDMTAVREVFKSVTDLNEPIRRIHEDPHPLEIKELRVEDRYLYLFIAPVIEDDETIGSVVIFEDITDEVALNRSKDEFFIIASHELRTPLTKIRGSAELINDIYKTSISSKEALHMVDEIEKSSGHLIEVVNTMIQISELEQGKTTFKAESVDVVALTREVLQEIARKIPRPGVKPMISCSLRELVITIDRESLRQILAGFVSNAYKFTEEGNVTVHIKPDGDFVRFRISDTGKGIEQENHGLLFRKFQQAGASLLSRDGEGTGLGLYVVKLLVNGIGGQAGLEDSEVGKGTTFYFTVPVRPQTKAPTAVAKTARL